MKGIEAFEAMMFEGKTIIYALQVRYMFMDKMGAVYILHFEKGKGIVDEEGNLVEWKAYFWEVDYWRIYKRKEKEISKEIAMLPEEIPFSEMDCHPARLVNLVNDIIKYLKARQ